MIKKFRDQNRNEKNVGIKIKTTQNKDKKIFSPNFYIPRRDSNGAIGSKSYKRNQSKYISSVKVLRN